MVDVTPEEPIEYSAAQIEACVAAALIASLALQNPDRAERICSIILFGFAIVKEATDG